MKKFVVFSGFLGSGKTTAMMALTRYYTEHYAKAAMISNDLSEGNNLADNRLAQLSSCNASEITGECICYCHDVLTERLNAYFDEGCELVVSDIPGFGVGALEHVYHGLAAEYPGQYELGPFTVLIEPGNAKLLLSGKSADMTHILDAQLREADLIVLNKRDLLGNDETETVLSGLASKYPEARVIAISAARGEGLEELAQALRNGESALRRPDIDYVGEGLQREMGSISEYYIQYHAVVCCNDFDGTAYLEEMASAVQNGIRDCGCEIPHLKLLAWEQEGDYGKVDLLGTGRPIEITHRFERPCTELAVVLNASAACPDTKLDGIITNAMSVVSERFGLEVMIFRKECFGMG
ncbi:MAG: hypothetical protein J5569_05900 [Oscillospiraceae bacterium]|nr:hypothetical protein [Oscillospiraceae bacterium]